MAVTDHVLVKMDNFVIIINVAPLTVMENNVVAMVVVGHVAIVNR